MAASAPPYSLDYLVILDLEAVCDDPVDLSRMEIVELPWLVFDLSTHAILDYKQIFIAPHWNLNPNPPPDAVRGLSADVAFADSLEDAIIQFDAYICASFLVSGKTFCLLTDGPWDLKDMLYAEASRKALTLPPYFRTYINLRAEFVRCYPHAPVPTDRRSMFVYLDISTEPRASGLDECVALSSVVTSLLREGHRLTSPEIVTNCDWATLATRVPAIAMPVATAIPVGGIVRLRGLPWSCTEDDIVEFFRGLTIVPAGIQFVRNSQGKATGEAFVQLDSPEAVQAALTRHKEMMGRRYIEVFKSSPADMLNHLGRADARRQMAGGYSNRGHGSGVGGVMGQSFSGSASPISQRSAGFEGGLWKGGKGEKWKDGGMAESWVVKVSGMPKEAVADDLAGLFEGVEVVREGIHLVKEAGACMGDAFVEVGGEAWAKKVLGRSGMAVNIGGVAVTLEVRRSSAAQMRAAFGMVGDSDKRANGGGGKRNGGGKGDEGRYYVRIRNIGDEVGTDEVVELFEEFRVGDEDVRFSKQGVVANGNGEDKKKGRLERLAKVAFPSREARDAALAANRKSASLGGAQVVLEDGGSDWRGHAAGQRAVAAKGAGAGGFSSIGGAALTGALPLDHDPNRIVRMRGLPYSSNDDDIAEFFRGYTIAPGGISRGKDRHGRASGEAWVTFVTAEDAKEVVTKLDKAHMGSRYIELKF
eukprot:GFKZ01012467.1.p1 GENE.GFKZ01012467.1~~GFKZ01012467.1.p1  ORF type:complete len:702 (+),score=97.96 GFKZ01012467.1:322-2427(+)